LERTGYIYPKQKERALRQKTERSYVNRQIKLPEVLCIDIENNNLGKIPTNQALEIAEKQGLDLVQVGFNQQSRLPTCKIMDYGKHRYEVSKKLKVAQKKQKESIVKNKEIKLRPTTDIHDLKVKAKKVETFLDKNYNVKIVLMFRGREMSHKEVGLETLNMLINLIPNASLNSEIKSEGKVLSVLLVKSNADLS